MVTIHDTNYLVDTKFVGERRSMYYFGYFHEGKNCFNMDIINR